MEFDELYEEYEQEKKYDEDAYTEFEMKKEDMQIDILDLKDAYKKMQEVLNDLKDVEEYSQEDYDLLHILAEAINDLRINKENDLELLEERYL